MIHILRSPLKIILPRVKVKDKSFILNLNNYRNTNQFTLNDAKVKYKALMRRHILALPMFDHIEVAFVNYPKTKMIPDTNNVCCIHDKFFGDALVEFGKLQDDNPSYWIRSTYLFGAVDKSNPRVDIVIRPTTYKTFAGTY